MTTVWAGLSVGAVYALVALGYNIVYIGSGTLNFAHANLMVLGVFLAYWGLVQVGWPIVPIFVVAVVIVALAAVSEERFAIRPVREIQGQLVTMVGAATLITGIIEVIWGQEALTVPSFFSNTPTHVLGGAVRPRRSRAHRARRRLQHRVRTGEPVHHDRALRPGRLRGP